MRNKKTVSADESGRVGMVLADDRWQAIVKRDDAADGTFFYSVKTTGVFCRPSCNARLPRPENVQFYVTVAEAENAGFRACKRCRPDELPVSGRNAAMIEAACRSIQNATGRVTLAELAAAAGISTFHFHRVFKAITGLTPNGYAAAHRNDRIRFKLGKSRSVTDAIYDAGYNSSSRFYGTSDEVLGMTPSSYRAGAPDITVRFAIGTCFLGFILAARTERGICAILLGDDPKQLVRDLQQRYPKANLIRGFHHSDEDVLTQVIALVEEPQAGHALPLDIRGTAFQQRVWNALRMIPLGATVTYTEIAEKIGAPKACRAVAQACAANALAIAIPCHRVVRNNGDLSGYRWGKERKRQLLEIERERGNGQR